MTNEMNFRQKKHAFITWLVVRDRMMTRDKLITWGINVPPTCLLCGVGNESTAHIFFECDYASIVLSRLFERSGLQIPTRLEEVVRWIMSCQVDGKFKTVMKLLFQAAIYFLWKERNSRLQSSLLRPSQLIVRDGFLHLRAKLFSLDKEEKNSTAPPSITSGTISNHFSKHTSIPSGLIECKDKEVRIAE